jgi:hypothetical protein
MLAFSRVESDTEWGIFVVPVDENINPTASPGRMNTPKGLNREPPGRWTGKHWSLYTGARQRLVCGACLSVEILRQSSWFCREASNLGRLLPPLVTGWHSPATTPA